MAKRTRKPDKRRRSGLGASPEGHGQLMVRRLEDREFVLRHFDEDIKQANCFAALDHLVGTRALTLMANIDAQYAEGHPIPSDLKKKFDALHQADRNATGRFQKACLVK